MKNFFLFLTLLFGATNVFSQSVIDGCYITTKESLLNNTSLTFFSEKINLNVDDYQLLSMTEITEKIKELREKNISFKLVNQTITFTSHNNFFIDAKTITYNEKTKRYLNVKYLYCDYSLFKNSEGNYVILFYYVE